MGVIEDIGTYLAANGIGTLGATLYYNVMPDESSAVCTALFEVNSRPPHRTMGAATYSWEKPHLLVVVRSTAPIGGEGLASSTGARSKIGTIWTLVQGITNENVNSQYYMNVDPLNSPYLSNRDGRGRVSFQFTMEAWRTT